MSGTPKYKKTLLGKDEKLTLKEAITLCRVHEASLSHMEQFQSLGKYDKQLQGKYDPSKSSISAVKHTDSCPYCGGCHPPPRSKCPASGTKCKKCCRMGHWKYVCHGRSRPRQKQYAQGNTSPNRGRKPYNSRNRKSGHYRSNSGNRHGGVHEVQQYDDTMPEKFDTMHLESVTFKAIDGIVSGKSHSDTRDEIYAELEIQIPHWPGIHTMKTKIDTGAQGNILPLRVFRRMCPDQLTAEGYPKPGSTTTRHTILTAYNGTNIQQFGSVKIPTGYNGQWTEAEFFIAETEGPIILGLPSSRCLRLVTVKSTQMSMPIKITIKRDTSTTKISDPSTGSTNLGMHTPTASQELENFQGSST